MTRTSKLWRDTHRGLDGLFSLYEVPWNIRPQLIWMLTTTPFATQPENFYLLCLSDKSEMSRLEVWSLFFDVISVFFKGSTVNLFSELSTKAANRLLLFRYLHKNWTQQVFLRSTLRKLTFEKPVRPVFSLSSKNHKVSKELENLWKCSQDQFAASLWFINLSGVFSSNVRFRQHFAHCALLTTQQRAAAEPRFSTEQLQRCWSSKRFVLQFAGKLRLSKHELES